MKIDLAEHCTRLPLPATSKWPEGVWDIDAFRHGTMTLILFAPRGKDYQTTHDQDELYVVLSGSGTLLRNEIRYEFESGDALFVPAGEDHHFEDFSADLRLWAIFWGPQGGEHD